MTHLKKTATSHSDDPFPPKKIFKAGDVLFSDGDQSYSLFIIVKGTITIRKAKLNGQIEITRLSTNEVLGELSFFDRLPRSATAMALTDVEAHEISFDALDKIYSVLPVYFRAIVSSVAFRLRKANETIRELQHEVIYRRSERKTQKK